MALTKPILNQVPAWDATKGYTFTFNVVGGTQVAGSVLTIRDNETNVVVYQHTESSWRFENTIPANVLSNGVSYNASLTTLDINLNPSIESNIIQFYCYSSPVIEFDNVPVGDVIPSSEFPFEATYSQDEGEQLNTYSFSLYSSSQVRIATSGTMYATNIQSSYQGDTILTPLTYTFSGLADNTTYYIKVDGLTVNGTQVTTGMVQFVVRYQTPSAFAKLTAINNCDRGYIRLESNVVLIDGTAFPEAQYVSDSKIDVSQDGWYVEFDKGYSINDDFTIQIWANSINRDSLLATMNNIAGNNLKLYCVSDEYDSTLSYCVLIVDNKYIIRSNSVKFTAVCISIRRQSGLYDLYVRRTDI